MGLQLKESTAILLLNDFDFGRKMAIISDIIRVLFTGNLFNLISDLASIPIPFVHSISFHIFAFDHWSARFSLNALVVFINLLVAVFLIAEH